MAARIQSVYLGGQMGVSLSVRPYTPSTEYYRVKMDLQGHKKAKCCAGDQDKLLDRV